MSSYNPYQAPQFGGAAGGPPPILVPRRTLPTLCVVVFAIDLCLCGLQIVNVALAVGGYISRLDGTDVELSTAWFMLHLCLGLCVVLFSVTADVAMLQRQKWGAYVAVAALLMTLGSIGEQAYNSYTSYDAILAPGELENVFLVGLLIGILIPLLIRFAIAFVYTISVIVFWRWIQEGLQGPMAPPGYGYSAGYGP
jgi:hypothetical protein